LQQFVCDYQQKPFWRDYFKLSINLRSGKKYELPFTSSYGRFSIYPYHNILLLKYGKGRGTCARQEYVKCVKFSEIELIELFDFQVGHWVASDNTEKMTPDYFEYTMSIQQEENKSTIVFDGRGRGIRASG